MHVDKPPISMSRIASLGLYNRIRIPVSNDFPRQASLSLSLSLSLFTYLSNLPAQVPKASTYLATYLGILSKPSQHVKNGYLHV